MNDQSVIIAYDCPKLMLLLKKIKMHSHIAKTLIEMFARSQIYLIMLNVWDKNHVKFHLPQQTNLVEWRNYPVSNKNAWNTKMLYFDIMYMYLPKCHCRLIPFIKVICLFLESLTSNTLITLLVCSRIFVSKIPQWPIGLRSKVTNVSRSP